MPIQQARAFAILALCCSLPGYAQEPDKSFNIRRADARCLLNNESRYATLARDPAILFLSLCPNVDPTPREIARLNRNQYFLKIRVKEETPTRSVVMIPRRQLPCFLKQVRSRSKKNVGDVVPIDLGMCR
jgi:hypothetical protein